MAVTTKNRIGKNGTLQHEEPAIDHDEAPVMERITITPPKFAHVTVRIRGTTPLVICRFSQKALNMMKGRQEEGSQGNKGKKRDPKNFQQCYEDAKYVSHDGWCGVNASGFRRAMVEACRLVGFKMTLAKLGVFVEADGFDKFDGTPLVRIEKKEPHYCEHATRNATGVADIRARAMWDSGWEMGVRIRFDRDMFSATDIFNLMARVGLQNGIGEGRANGKKSTGMGWGEFEVLPSE